MEKIHTGTFVPGRAGERKTLLAFVSFSTCLWKLFQVSDFRVYELFIKMLSQVSSPHSMTGNVQMSIGFHLG